jgi:hypothetical protein
LPRNEADQNRAFNMVSQNQYTQRETLSKRPLFRRSALNFFEIRQVFPQKFALPGEKMSRLSGIPRCVYWFLILGFEAYDLVIKTVE